MKKYFIMAVSVLVFFIFLSTAALASWITLSLDGRFSYDDTRSSKTDDTGPTSSQSANLTFTIPFLASTPLKGATGITKSTTISGETRSFRVTLNLSHPIYSLQGSRSEDDKEDYTGGGSVSVRNDFNASFTPKELLLPQLRYSFSESDTDLGGATNSFNFKVNENIRPGSKLGINMGYSINKNIDIFNDSENVDQRINLRIDSLPVSNLKLGLSRDYGLTDDTRSTQPQTENIRTSYDASLSRFINVDPFKDVTLAWRRSEDFTSSSSDLRVSTSKSLSMGLKPFDKMDIKYDYSLNEDENDLDVSSSNNTGQNLSVNIPLKFDVSLRYSYSMRRTANLDGTGTNSEDNGFVIGYKSPIIKGSDINLSFSFDTDSKQVITDTDTKQQDTYNWGVDGRSKMLKVLDINFSHRDSITKSNTYDDDQESVSDSIGTAFRYNILQLINGNLDLRYNSRASNANTQTSEGVDRSISNNIDYRTGNLGMGLSMTYTENETENVTSKRGISPNLSYGLSRGRISLRYSITERVDEDPITGVLTTSRDATYDMGFAYDVAPQAKLDVRYSARNHIDLENDQNNDDGEKFSTGLSFKF